MSPYPALCATLIRHLDMLDYNTNKKKGLEVERELCWAQENSWRDGVRVDIIKTVAA